MISDDLLKKAVLEAYATLAEQFEDVDVSAEEKLKQQSVADDIDDEGVRIRSSKKSNVEVEEDEEKEDSEPTDLVKDKGKDPEEKFSYDIPDNVPKNVKFKDIIAQLNSVRSGASAKDDEVKLGLLKYFENLDDAEKQSLFSMLSGFATIMNKAGGVEDAPMPDKGDKPNASDDIEKIPTKKIGNAPIVVGESASKDREFLIVVENAGEQHRCSNGRVVPFGSERCLKDISCRMSDTEISRDACNRGSEVRSHHNGMLKYLRMQLRAAQKIHNKSVNS